MTTNTPPSNAELHGRLSSLERIVLEVQRILNEQIEGHACVKQEELEKQMKRVSSEISARQIRRAARRQNVEINQNNAQIFLQMKEQLETVQRQFDCNMMAFGPCVEMRNLPFWPVEEEEEEEERPPKKARPPHEKAASKKDEDKDEDGNPVKGPTA